jgi:hypothetical protein
VRNVIPRGLRFLFSRPQGEELAAEHIVREHHFGRVMEDIVHDPYLTDHCTREQLRRVLDRPEVVRAVADDTAAAHLGSGGDRHG